MEISKILKNPLHSCSYLIGAIIIGYLGCHSISKIINNYCKTEKIDQIANDLLLHQKQEIARDVAADLEQIRAGNRTPKIPVCHRGNHMKVVEHVKHPQWVIKFAPRTGVNEENNEMLRNITFCQQKVRENKLDTCIIPRAEVVFENKNSVSLLIMEKLKGSLSPEETRDQSEIAFEKFSTNEGLRAFWEKMLIQAAEFIALTGYWDVCWSNILILKNGLGFIDFEGVEPNEENISRGLLRLINMAPVEFIDRIVAIATKYNIILGNIEEIKAQRYFELALNSKVRAFHREQKIGYNQKIKDYQLDGLGIDERKIINKFNKVIEENSKDACYSGSLLAQRKLKIQPYLSREGLSERDFEETLRNLQSRGILCDWTFKQQSESSKCLTLFHVYF